jgi:glyoxylase-like metal-dependent hydrolase (beta-lactamase superfamily II)
LSHFNEDLKMHTQTIVHQFSLGPWGNFIHLIADARTNTCAVVDPAWHAPTIMAEAAKRNWRITDVLCTHSHVDHVNRVDAIVEATDARVHMLDAEVRFSGFSAGNLMVHRPGDQIEIGRSTLMTIHTPGHTPGSTSFWDANSSTLITGDTLFVNGCGRCDLKGSDPVAMYKSLKMLREELPKQTRIYPGHDYGATTTSTIEHEAKTNRFMVLPSIFDFVGVRMKGRVQNTELSQAPDWQPA